MDLALLGLVIAAVGLAIATVFGSVQIYLSRRDLQAKTRLGRDVAEDLEKLGQVTLKAIESVHKSIKDELK